VVSGAINAVTDAVGSVVEKVRDAVDGAINRGANQIKTPAPRPTKTDASDPSRTGRDRSGLNGSTGRS